MVTWRRCLGSLCFCFDREQAVERHRERAGERVHMVMFRRSLSNQAWGGGRGGAAGGERRGEERRARLAGGWVTFLCFLSHWGTEGRSNVGSKVNPHLPPPAARHSVTGPSCVCMTEWETEGNRGEIETLQGWLWFLHDSLFPFNQWLDSMRGSISVCLVALWAHKNDYIIVGLITKDSISLLVCPICNKSTL